MRGRRIHPHALPAGIFQNRDRNGAPMGLRPTKSDQDAAGPFRGINNLRRVFNGAHHMSGVGNTPLARGTRKTSACQRTRSAGEDVSCQRSRF